MDRLDMIPYLVIIICILAFIAGYLVGKGDKNKHQ